MKNTKISIYTKSGERAATTYYRIYQYVREIENVYRYRKMIPDKMYQRIMPISSKSHITKLSIFTYLIIRVFIQLLKDTIDRPDVLIVSRRFVNRVFPYPYKWMLDSMKKRGTKIIWDFDDEIIAAKEITHKGFDYMSRLADHIIVASPVNKDMVKPIYQDKVTVLPTTDGDMYNRLTPEVTAKRVELLTDEIRLVWVGTSVTLKYVKLICPYLDLFAEVVKEKYNKTLILTIVCNQALEINDLNHLIVRNVQWERDVAISEMFNSHIGLMPLEDSKVTRGKGGFKLIQYLSAGLPIIGSPVGINTSIISNDVGCQISDIQSYQWGEKIYDICKSKDSWLSMSKAAYEKWQREFNYTMHLKIWEQLIVKN